MKILIASVSLLVGLIIGCYIGYKCYERHITNEAVEQMLKTIESQDGEEAARDVRAIELIESGEAQNAVQMLSKPIPQYYYLYAVHAATDQERKMRDMIEQLVSTNKIVADEMTNQMVNFEINGKIQ
jgi:uncharacterized protein YneF (UPF0154 family)